MATAKTLATLMEELEAACKDYVACVNSHGKKTEQRTKKSAAQAKLSEYNAENAKLTYKKWAKAGNAIENAIASLFVPGSKKIKYDTNDDGIMTYKINDNPKYEVSLPDMHAILGAKAFANPAWFDMASNLAWLVAMNLNDRFGDSASFVYEVNEAAKNFEFPDGIDPLSEDGAIIAIQQVFDAICFIPSEEDEKVNKIHTTTCVTKRGETSSPQWETVRESMTEGDGGDVEICGTGRFSSILLHCMHKIYDGGAFALKNEK